MSQTLSVDHGGGFYITVKSQTQNLLCFPQVMVARRDRVEDVTDTERGPWGRVLYHGKIPNSKPSVFSAGHGSAPRSGGDRLAAHRKCPAPSWKRVMIIGSALEMSYDHQKCPAPSWKRVMIIRSALEMSYDHQNSVFLPIWVTNFTRLPELGFFLPIFRSWVKMLLIWQRWVKNIHL